MMVLELIRLEDDHQFGTFGVLKVNKQVFCVTLEPPDLLNKEDISSIPAKQYQCWPYSSEKYPDTYQVMNVPGRSRILFHSGNLVKHTQGCILLAQHFGKLRDNRAVLNSGATFKKFIAQANREDQIHLTITETY